MPVFLLLCAPKVWGRGKLPGFPLSFSNLGPNHMLQVCLSCLELHRDAALWSWHTEFVLPNTAMGCEAILSDCMSGMYRKLLFGSNML